MWQTSRTAPCEKLFKFIAHFHTTFTVMAPASRKLADPRDLQFGNQQPRHHPLGAARRGAAARVVAARGVEFLRATWWSSWSAAGASSTAPPTPWRRRRPMPPAAPLQ